jgi:alpha-amylase
VVASALPVDVQSALPTATAAVTDWSGESIYMVMTDRFRNGDPSNDLDSDGARADWWHGGDLQGVIDELPYIKGLGMTAVWITPVAEQMPGGYHGYWTRDFYKVDPHLGDMAKLAEFVRRAHELGLKVVLDVVVNHVGQRNPWLTDGAHAAWFHPDCVINFADQRSVENCWLAGLPDLDTENPAVRAYLTDWALWLIDQTSADGFRVDAARHLSKDFLKAWTGAIKAKHPSFWLLGEVYSSGYRYQSGFLDAGLDAVTDFQTYDVIRTGLSVPGNLSQLSLPPGLAAADIGAGHETARAIFLDNHDVARFVGPDPPSAVTLARLRQGLVYLFTMPGTPVLYYGTEIALPGGPDPDDRRSMSWAEASSDVRDLVKTLAQLRRQPFGSGEFVELVAGQQELAYARRSGTTAVLVVLNGDPKASRTVSVPLASLGLGSDIIATDALAPLAGSVSSGGGTFRVDVPPRGAMVWLVSARASGSTWPIALVGTILLAAAAIVATLRRRRATQGAR